MKKNKFLIVFLTIITFGLIWIKWNKQSKKEKNTIYQNDKLPFKISDFLTATGENNITALSTRLNRINVEVKDIKKVNLENIKKMKGISGIFAKSQSFSIVLGEYTQVVYQELSKLLK
ncbi:PTS sugar transporter subunit IIABC [Mycoplasma seminis]|uniref:PTS sugar transporter subunit IIABC n=1 Tax=Mycoplasma seminis TaxID=512749 RepID=A0ABY9HAD4_9MOLU|nr:PTS sugar transporter subunit IIABC [Mycoplasma seminis]WLP85154.1 PTS sugar transporter subunit IIABC [Mycoplasma seminis]